MAVEKHPEMARFAKVPGHPIGLTKMKQRKIGEK